MDRQTDEIKIATATSNMLNVHRNTVSSAETESTVFNKPEVTKCQVLHEKMHTNVNE